jgi:hypothetical protein
VDRHRRESPSPARELVALSPESPAYRSAGADLSRPARIGDPRQVIPRLPAGHPRSIFPFGTDSAQPYDAPGCNNVTQRELKVERSRSPMRQVVIENPILNSPYDEPNRHFRFSDEGITNEREHGI